MIYKNICKILFLLSIVFFTQTAYSQEETATEEQNILKQVRWSPYAVGAGIGILSMLTFGISNEAIGVSGAFARTSAMIEKEINGSQAEEKKYYKKHPPKINWEWMFVLGLIIGSFVSATLSGDFKFVMVPERWEQSAGGSGLFRWAAAFIGGVLMGFGARWARGCTSGHGISGTLQLAVSSWIATIALFISGIITAMILFHLIF